MRKQMPKTDNEHEANEIVPFIYDTCYLVGAQFLRNVRQSARLSRQFFELVKAASVRWAVGKYLRVRRAHMLRAGASKRRQNLRYERLQYEFTRLNTAIKAKQSGAICRCVGCTLRELLRVAAPVARTGFNYLFPAASIAVLVLTIQHYTNQEFVLSVTYDGEEIGYVLDESVFDRAQEQVKEKIIYEEYKQPQDSLPEFKVVAVDEAQPTDVDELSDRIIVSSGNEIKEASGLYVDDRFVGAVEDSTDLLTLLDSIKEPYRTGASDERVEFINSISVKDGLYPVSSVVDLSNINETITEEVQTERQYTVEEGDAPTLIAQKNDIPYETLLQLNPNIESKLLIGDIVTIARAEPYLGVQVVRTETYNEDIPYTSKTVESDKYLSGYRAVSEEGQEGVAKVTSEVTYVNGLITNEKVIKRETLVDPVPETIVVGTKKLQAITPDTSSGSGGQELSSNFIWPTQGYISCGWLGYPGHYAIDFATNGRALPIVASAPGTVEKVQRLWTGYGLHVYINHGGGVRTLYAHCSSVNVQVGQVVQQGEVIGNVGMTGNASGYHCHFEIIINGVQVNPLNYLNK